MPHLGLRTGIDLGSTTSKITVFDSDDLLIYSSYRRHYGKVRESLIDSCHAIRQEIGNTELSLRITGSAGLGVSEKYDIPFVQELIASAEAVSHVSPDARTLIDIGGEDSKIIFFKSNNNHDIRMNGSCAGGTGAFIDQMISLLGIQTDEYDKLALGYERIYPIATRCGVFAKTDVQNLLSRDISKEDITASINFAVSLQVKNSLMRSSKASKKIIFSGGPLSFLKSLRNSIIEVFGFNEDDICSIEKPELFPAMGSALASDYSQLTLKPEELINRLQSGRSSGRQDSGATRLFVNEADYQNWKDRRDSYKAGRSDLSASNDYYLGIDSGSTTTKIVLIDQDQNIAFSHYANNNSNPIDAVRKGLRNLNDKCEELKIDPAIKATAVTGYGEDLIRAAFNLDYGIVETLAHKRASEIFLPDADFILDIGGQDMKAIFIRNGIVHSIEINEACSSGCGSFIETFANSMDYTVQKFAEIALFAGNPSELGTRCTVFMNSKVKQSFREGAELSDISAGLAYSVIKNCLHKVLKIHDSSVIGDKIMVQGGTFRNHAVHRAFEQILGKEVISPDIPELMGAFGSALTARDFARKDKPADRKFNLSESVSSEHGYKSKVVNCKGCDNFCTVSKLTFSNDNCFYTGNRCEDVFSNKGYIRKNECINIPKEKNRLLFERNLKPEGKAIMRIGIPRVLNMYENFPFWAELFTSCGFEIVISDKSNEKLVEKGSGYLMSDNICFPAKIVHGHIMDLIDKKVDRIFYPMVIFEKNEKKESTNSFNCPIVSGYPEVIDSSMNPEANYSIPLDIPSISFHDKKLTRKAIIEYFEKFDIPEQKIKKAVDRAFDAYSKYKNDVRELGNSVLRKIEKNESKAIVISGRPYQIDPVISLGLSTIVTEFGYDVLTEDSIPTDDIDIDDIQVLTQWSYPNRLYSTAKWVSQKENLELIQLNSFGCGPDTVAMDELKDITEKAGKVFTLIRVDEHSSTGSLRLRIRSLIESLKLKETKLKEERLQESRKTTKPFGKDDKHRTILLPYFSPFHKSYLSAPFEHEGYKVEVLPKPDRESVELGLKYVNNEICFPATLVIGDIIKALKSGEYNLDEIAVGITQTGGQCRASNYLSLIKKALVKNGFQSIPVIGISVAKNLKKLNDQPGFRLKKVTLIKQVILGVLFGDCMSRLYYSAASRSNNPDAIMAVADKYLDRVNYGVLHQDREYVLNLLKEAVDEFNTIAPDVENVPKVGVAGEIYVKLNSAGNVGILDELVNQHIEVVVPPLINMFAQWFVNIKVKADLHTEESMLMRYFAGRLENMYRKAFDQFNSVLNAYKYSVPLEYIRETAENAEKVISLGHHYYGEGWLIPGDIVSFVESGIKNVLCLQPFGCIANHIVARGIETRLKETYPDLNVLYLDIDAGVSEVNLHNRLYLLLKGLERA